MREDKFAETLAKVNRTMNATDEERETLRRLATAFSGPESDEQGERVHGVGTAAQGSSAGDTGGKR